MTDLSLETYTLNDEHLHPVIGFGTYELTGPVGQEAVTSAVATGYRLLDTAVMYQNEEEVGAGLAAAGAQGAGVLVQTKITRAAHSVDGAVESLRLSREKLGVKQIDLALIHWPNPAYDQYVQAWQGLISAREQGIVRSIGVSNFLPEHLARIIDATGVVPAVNQIEIHPAFPQVEAVAANAQLGILTQAWSPLGKHSALYEDPAVAEPAAECGVSPAQVILRWHYQRGIVPLPKSVHPERQRANLALDGFALTEAQLAAITALGRPDGRLFDGDPATVEEDRW